MPTQKDELDLEIEFGIKKRPSKAERKQKRALESAGIASRRSAESRLKDAGSEKERKAARRRIRAIKAAFGQD